MTLNFFDPFTANTRLVHKIKRYLYGADTEHQRIDVFETEDFGVLMALGGVANVSERDEANYHEMISHVPLFAHPDPRRVLIIGGGDGGTLRECVRHAGVERVTMVEIDEVVIEQCKRFLPRTASAFDHPKAELVIGDGLAYVKAHPEAFDVILVDSTDPVDAAVGLFQRPFYEDALRALRPGGVFVPQSDTIFYQPRRVKQIWDTLRELFPVVELYTTFVPIYPGSLWNFMFCSTGPHPLHDFDPARVAQSGLAFRYYNEQIHTASFALPTSYRRILDGTLPDAGAWRVPLEDL